jgi:hypothetical protein
MQLTTRAPHLLRVGRSLPSENRTFSELRFACVYLKGNAGRDEAVAQLQYEIIIDKDAYLDFHKNPRRFVPGRSWVYVHYPTEYTVSARKEIYDDDSVFLEELRSFLTYFLMNRYEIDNESQVWRNFEFRTGQTSASSETNSWIRETHQVTHRKEANRYPRINMTLEYFNAVYLFTAIDRYRWGYAEGVNPNGVHRYYKYNPAYDFGAEVKNLDFFLDLMNYVKKSAMLQWSEIKDSLKGANQGTREYFQANTYDMAWYTALRENPTEARDIKELADGHPDKIIQDDYYFNSGSRNTNFPVVSYGRSIAHALNLFYFGETSGR